MLNRQQAIIWINADPIDWRIYAALGGNQLKSDNQFDYDRKIHLSKLLVLEKLSGKSMKIMSQYMFTCHYNTVIKWSNINNNEKVMDLKEFSLFSTCFLHVLPNKSVLRNKIIHGLSWITIVGWLWDELHKQLHHLGYCNMSRVHVYHCGTSCEITLRYHRIPWLISQHWFRWWLGAVRQQAITWANVDPDLWCHMVPLSHNGLTHWGRVMPICISKLPSLVQIMACHLVSDKPLSEPMLEYYQFDC